MKSGYFIREMHINDYEKVIKLWRKSDGICLSDIDSKENIARHLSHNQGMSFIAEDGSEIIGAILCGHDTRRGYLHHLAVDMEYRQIGIGSKMIKVCLNKLSEAGIKKCHIFVLKDNIEGLAFWARKDWEMRTDIHVFSKKI